MVNFKTYVAEKDILRLVSNSGNNTIVTGSFNNLFHNVEYGRIPGDIDLSMPSNDVYASFLQALYQCDDQFQIVSEMNNYDFKKLEVLCRTNLSEEMIDVEIFIENMPHFKEYKLPSLFPGDDEFNILGIDINLYLAMKLYSYFETIEFPELGRYKDLYDLLTLAYADYDLNQLQSFYNALCSRYYSMDHVVNVLRDRNELVGVSELEHLNLNRFGEEHISEEGIARVKKIISIL